MKTIYKTAFGQLFYFRPGHFLRVGVAHATMHNSYFETFRLGDHNEGRLSFFIKSHSSTAASSNSLFICANLTLESLEPLDADGTNSDTGLTGLTALTSLSETYVYKQERGLVTEIHNLKRNCADVTFDGVKQHLKALAKCEHRVTWSSV